MSEFHTNVKMLFVLMNDSYNPVERRESRKGGKEMVRKSVNLQASNKPISSTNKAHSSHNNRRADVCSANTKNHSFKAVKPSSAAESIYEEQVIVSICLKDCAFFNIFVPESNPTLTEQITELKLSVDSLEKERDFYFSKLRDIEMLCQTPEIENSPVCLVFVF